MTSLWVVGCTVLLKKKFSAISLLDLMKLMKVFETMISGILSIMVYAHLMNTLRTGEAV